MNLQNSKITLASADDLDQVAAVIASAVDAWPAPARLKRNVLPGLIYDELDLADHEILLLSDLDRPIALGAWQTDTPMADPDHRTSTLLHGLFVAKQAQTRGIGRWLQVVIARRAHAAGFQGLHVKAARFATNYFARCGYRHLNAAEQPGDDAAAYPYWFWQDCIAIERALRPHQQDIGTPDCARTFFDHIETRT